jgi:Ankyrin repeats (3 copies)
LIRSRGYSTKPYPTLEGGYHYRPSELQKASYDPYLVSLVQQNRQGEICQMLDCGISPNPCNSYGESLIHTICHCGNASLLQIMLKAQSDTEVVDDHGQTPLHHACQSSKKNIFPVIELLISGGGKQQRDNDDSCPTNRVGSGPLLFYLADCWGSLPLEYVARKNWGVWIQWIEAHKDIYWPCRNIVMDGELSAPPPITLLPPQSRIAPVPTHPLPPALAKLLVSGLISPLEVKVLRCDNKSVDKDDVIMTNANWIDI